MPIYAYKCASCGHTQDVMQKLADAPLTVCTACGKASFAKQLTAPGFQLKGSGWYATDFKGGAKPVESKPAEGSDAKPAPAAEPKADTKTESSAAPTPAAPACNTP